MNVYSVRFMILALKYLRAIYNNRNIDRASICSADKLIGKLEEEQEHYLYGDGTN